ncbi:MAG: RsmB/NOP family class I SAM-dependent RNA methyltransferase [Propionibacteriaceae bacterium]|nr:RsmB/NOP family class I SAM-dependent RNA methyltransferase [Propionibacteriaceae bacterium]
MSPDPARRLAFDALRIVNGEGGYANLVLGQLLARRRLNPRDAAFATELFSGTCRLQGTYDRIVESASGRPLNSLQPAVLDLLRLGAHQVLAMRMPQRAAVAATVDLARSTVGQRVTGLVNAVLRRVGTHALSAWIEQLAAGNPAERLGILTHHPQWIADAYHDLLGEEATEALLANNLPPQPCLVVRPGLAEVAELGGEPTRLSPFGALASGNPADVAAVREGRAGVQDEGSQLVAWALSRVEAPDGPWLDLCAGPGGKSALLAGLARDCGEWLLANEVQLHRAGLVSKALASYPAGQDSSPVVVAADGTRPAWRPGSFARVLADVPCTGLGALRRRPESRWRRDPADVEQLHPLQAGLLRAAIESAMPGGVVAYVTCSPHRRETADVVEEVLASTPGVHPLPAGDYLPEVPDCRLGDAVQLWPHRHSTDAMYLALLRVDARSAGP